MRQLIIQVPKGQGQEVLDLAKSYNGANLAQFEANNNDGEIDVVIVNIFGLSTQGSRYQRGKKGVFPAALSVTLIALLALPWEKWLELPWVIGSLIICGSIIVHGFIAIPFSKFYGERFGKRPGISRLSQYVE